MVPTHVVTGATGFVGGALVLELLQRTSDDVVCLVRPQSSDANGRLRQSLLHAAESYGIADVVAESIKTRCRAIAGDVEQPDCGVAALDGLSCTQFWHSAASLRFEDRYADEIMRTNVDGTQHALNLAARLGSPQFNYVSTAYVCGSQSGRIPETPVSATRHNNHYERSKAAAEELVAKETRFGRRIFRPSIVIGHSHTLGATNFTGMYGFLRRLTVFAGLMDRTQSGLMNHKSLRLRVDADALLNFVPIDRVVANAVTIAQSSRCESGHVDYYHLTNPTPPSMSQSLDTMFAVTALAAPTYAKDVSEFDWLDEKFNERIDFYRSYLVGYKVFDRSNVLRIVGDEPSDSYDLSPAVLERHYRWYVERLRQERAGLPETR